MPSRCIAILVGMTGFEPATVNPSAGLFAYGQIGTDSNLFAQGQVMAGDYTFNNGADSQNASIGRPLVVASDERSACRLRGTRSATMIAVWWRSYYSAYCNRLPARLLALVPISQSRLSVYARV